MVSCTTACGDSEHLCMFESRRCPVPGLGSLGNNDILELMGCFGLHSFSCSKADVVEGRAVLVPQKKVGVHSVGQLMHSLGLQILTSGMSICSYPASIYSSLSKSKTKQAIEANKCFIDVAPLLVRVCTCA